MRELTHGMAGERHGRGMGTTCYVWIRLKEAVTIFLSIFPILRRARVIEYKSGWSSEPVRTLRRWEEYITRSENGTMIRPARIPVTIPTMQCRLQIRPSYYRHDCPNFWGVIHPVPFWWFSFPLFIKKYVIICWLKENHVPSELHPSYTYVRPTLLVLWKRNSMSQTNTASDIPPVQN